MIVRLFASGAAFCAVAFNTVFGLLAGWTLSRYRFWGKAMLASAVELRTVRTHIHPGTYLSLFSARE